MIANTGGSGFDNGERGTGVIAGGRFAGSAIARRSQCSHKILGSTNAHNVIRATSTFARMKTDRSRAFAANKGKN